MTEVLIDNSLFGRPVAIRTKAATIIGTLTAKLQDNQNTSLVLTNVVRTLERDGHVDFIHELHLDRNKVKSIESAETRTPRLFRAKCGKCGYTIHVPETWAAKGFPICVCGGRITPYAK
jgi:hypothetical protein